MIYGAYQGERDLTDKNCFDASVLYLNRPSAGIYGTADFLTAEPPALRYFFFHESERRKLMTREEKDIQIRKEARATGILFLICFLWHVGFGYLLSGSGITVCGLPLWWILSTPGVFVVAVVGVVYLLKNVFINFSLDDEDEAGEEA